jgi:hypothetical protein
VRATLRERVTARRGRGVERSDSHRRARRRCEPSLQLHQPPRCAVVRRARIGFSTFTLCPHPLHLLRREYYMAAQRSPYSNTHLLPVCSKITQAEGDDGGQSTGVARFVDQVYALIIKRALNSYRDRLAVLTQVLTHRSSHPHFAPSAAPWTRCTHRRATRGVRI